MHKFSHMMGPIESALCLANRTALHKGSGSAFKRADISAVQIVPKDREVGHHGKHKGIDARRMVD